MKIPNNIAKLKSLTGKISWWELFILFPFGICVGFLMVVGRLLGVSYKRVAVIVNIYLQGVVLMASGLLPFVASVWSLLHHFSFLTLVIVFFTLVYASLYVVAFIMLVRRYHIPMDGAFDLCVKDLNGIASRWNISYYAVNLLVFVLWWLAVLGVNLLLAWKLLPLV